MLRVWGFLLTMLLSVVSLAHSQESPASGTRLTRAATVDLNQQEQAWLEQRGRVIRIAPDPNFPPIEWFDEKGQYRGFVADFFRLMESRLGVHFEIVRCATWEEVLKKAREREIDLITAAQITPERKVYLTFTNPIIDIPNVIIVPREKTGEFQFATMKGMRVAVTRGNALDEYLRTSFPEVTVVPVEDDLTGLREVSFKRADATVVNLAIASWLIEKHGIANLRVAGDSGRNNHLAIACRSDQPLLASIMEHGLHAVTEEEKRRLLNVWVTLEGDHGFFSAAFWRRFQYALAAFVFLLAGILLWNWMLRHQVRLRTVELQAELAARKLAERNLIEEKERLAVTLRSIGEGFMTTDTEQRVTLMNRLAETLTGWSVADALGKKLDEVFPFRENVSGNAEKNGKTGVEVGKAVSEANGEVEVLPRRQVGTLASRDGRSLVISRTVAPISDVASGFVGLVVVFHDITDQERIERELQRIQRLESLGILAGGIAHDFNNILMAILGNMSLAKNELEPESQAVKILDEAGKAIATARGLTRQLLTFARGGAPVRHLCSIRTLLIDSANLVLSGSNVSCSFSLPDDLWTAEVDEGQFGQVMQNLVLNAKQAMPNGGRVEVNAANRQLTAESGLPLRSGAFVEIAIRDHGCGISPENLAQVFDPFFTTKPSGHGLGLSTAFSIIEKHGGHMTVDSKVGTGTTFRIFIPATPEKVPQKPSGRSISRTAQGHILVMDDEESICKVIQGMLGHLGYTSFGVRDGAAALKEYQRARDEGRPYQAVILDLTIRNGMGGREAANEFRKIDPLARLVVVSGYSGDPVMADFASFGFCGAIGKPFTLEEIARTMNVAVPGQLP